MLNPKTDMSNEGFTPTAVGIVCGISMLKARRARANKLARMGMRMHGFDQHDQVAWSIFYRCADAYLSEVGHFTQSDKRVTPKTQAAINAMYELAAAETNFKKNLF